MPIKKPTFGPLVIVMKNVVSTNKPFEKLVLVNSIASLISINFITANKIMTDSRTCGVWANIPVKKARATKTIVTLINDESFDFAPDW